MSWFTETKYHFRDPGPLADGELTLVLERTIVADPRRGLVPSYEFEMRHTDTGERMGRLGLRIGHTEFIEMYVGHIGYSVLPAFRGHRYAARSCRLIFPFAKEEGINPVWITVNPDNMPSRRTCEILDARYVETVALPTDCDMYRIGERLKCRYRVDL